MFVNSLDTAMAIDGANPRISLLKFFTDTVDGVTAISGLESFYRN